MFQRVSEGLRGLKVYGFGFCSRELTQVGGRAVEIFRCFLGGIWDDTLNPKPYTLNPKH